MGVAFFEGDSMLKWVKRYKPDVNEVLKDMRLFGKVLFASFFAIVIYPGDATNIALGWYALAGGIGFYLVGLHKVGVS